MGGFFGAALKHDAMLDVFFGVDYHSHLGTQRAGMAAFDDNIGFQREIHNITNSPFRTKFEGIVDEMHGTSAIGCISDTDAQPILIRSNLGTYAISTIGKINNSEALVKQFISFSGGHFNAMTSGKVNTTELAAAMINQKSSFAAGIRFAQDMIEGSSSILILCEDKSLIAARDKMGRIPVIIGKSENGFCVSFESFAFEKLGYTAYKELGPGEIVKITPEEVTVLAPAEKEKRVCSFLWTYYGYPTSAYEGMNIELMRMKSGELMAEREMEEGTLPDVDYVCGIPDSGTPNAIGYSNKSGIPYARPFIKYTPTWPRSFMPSSQTERNHVAKMKLIPVRELIEGKKLLFVDDSIVRGTQLRETVEFLYENGAKEVHMRSACPPILFSCKYLNFSRSTSEMDLIARRVIMELEGEEGFNHLEEYSDRNFERGKNLRRTICEKFHFSSLEFQSLDLLEKSIGLNQCELCTYCWNGKE